MSQNSGNTDKPRISFFFDRFFINRSPGTQVFLFLFGTTKSSNCPAENTNTEFSDMSFAYPLFLFAIVALAIPLIIHLFNFKRYRTVFFSNVWLLKKLKQETKRKSKLKQLLILTARLLALASLVFAFARPYIPVSNQAPRAVKQTVAIYIDNSFSMKNEGENGILMEQAKAKAIDIANTYGLQTQFLLVTSDFEPEHQFPLSREQFIQEVSKVKESPKSPQLSVVYKNATNLLGRLGEKSDKALYLLSDFQKANSDLQAIAADTSVWTNIWQLSPAKSNNLSIDTCWFEVPGRKIGQQEKLFVRIQNFSGQAYQNIPVRLLINDTLKAIATINIDGLETKTTELNYTNNSEGIQLCKIEIDDYPIIYDNQYFMNYRVLGRLNTLGIYGLPGEGSKYLKALLANDELTNYEESSDNALQIAQLKNFQCIFLINNPHIGSGLRESLSDFVAAGGTVVVFPPKLTKYDEYNQLLRSLNGKAIVGFDSTRLGLSEINYDSELYRNVFGKKEQDGDLPIIKGHVVFEESLRGSSTKELGFRNGKEALTKHRLEKGTIYTFAFPLDEAHLSFVSHVLFVPTIYNIVLNSGEHQHYAYSTAFTETVLLSAGEPVSEVRLRNKTTGDEFLASVKAAGSGELQIDLTGFYAEAGQYFLRNDGKTISALSFNYPRSESSPEYLSRTDLKSWVNSEKNTAFHLIEGESLTNGELQEINNGRQLWKYFIALAIFFLACEMAVIRFWK